MKNTEEMERMVYRIYREAGRDYVTMEWNGYATSEEFREGTRKMLMELEKNGLHKVLGEISEMVLIGREDQQWVQDEFMPLAMSKGFKALALVQPLNYFNKVAIESMAYQLNDEKVSIRIFSNVEEAKAWLSADIESISTM